MAHFFVLRTPLLPIDRWLSFAGGTAFVSATGLDADDYEERVIRHTGDLERDPSFRLALHLGAPSFSDRLRTSGKDAERSNIGIRTALVRYLARSAGRPTPLGLFAGASYGTVGGSNDLRLSEASGHVRRTRVDFAILQDIEELVRKTAAGRSAARWKRNPDIAEFTDDIHHIRRRLRTDSNAAPDRGLIISTQRSATVDELLSIAEEPGTVEALARRTALLFDIEVSEASSYFDSLADSGLIVPSDSLSVCGPPPIDQLLGILPDHPDLADIHTALSGVRESLTLADESDPTTAAAFYVRACDGLKQLYSALGSEPPVSDLRFSLLTDLIKPTPDLRMSNKIVQEIIAGVEILTELGQGESDPLRAFRDEFVARYERREIPLLEALDPEYGIGFGDMSTAHDSPLLVGLGSPIKSDSSGSRRRQVLASLLPGSPASPYEVSLDLAAFEKTDVRLPSACLVRFSIAASSSAALDGGDYRLILHSVSAPNAGGHLGRFCGSDANLAAAVRAMLEREQDREPDVVLAELVHAPPGRQANLVTRPSLRKAEIPYLCPGSVSPKDQFSVADLLVSVRKGRVILRSRSRSVELRPRLCSAHNYTNPLCLPIYQFLATLQAQDRRGVERWHWGDYDDLEFLPRVSAGRLVLARAQWLLSSADLRAIGASAKNWHVLKNVVAQLKERLRLPRFVVLVETETELLLDLDERTCLEWFARRARSANGARLVEMLPCPEELPVHNSQGRFVHEILLPLEEVQGRHPAEVPARRRKVHSISPPVHPPGSSWVYAKLYTGHALADTVIQRDLPRMVERLCDLVDEPSWFLVRYTDPAWHLRIRVAVPGEVNASAVRESVLRDLSSVVDTGRAWKLQLDTFQPEYERYGGEAGVAAAHQLFCADSNAVLLLSSESRWRDQGLRWVTLAQGINRYFDDFGLYPMERIALLTRVFERMRSDLTFDSDLGDWLSARYRLERTRLDESLEADASDEANTRWLRQRSISNVAIVESLRHQISSGAIAASLDGYLESILHMHANRVLRSAHRLHELVVYNFLSRHYRSTQARLGSDLQGSVSQKGTK